MGCTKMDYCACGAAATHRCGCGAHTCFAHTHFAFGSRTGHPAGPVALHVFSAFDPHRKMCFACCDRTYTELADSVSREFSGSPAASVAAQLIQNQLWTSHLRGTESLGVRVAQRLAPHAPWSLDQPLAAAAALLAERGTPEELTVFGPESRLLRQRKPRASGPGWLITVSDSGEWSGSRYSFVVGRRGAVYELKALRVGLHESRMIENLGFDADHFAEALRAEPVNIPSPLTTVDDTAATAVLSRAGY